MLPKQELVKAAKKYLYWLQTADGRSGDYSVVVERDNERMFAVNNGYAINEVYARPKNPDSCRGGTLSFFFFRVF